MLLKSFHSDSVNSPNSYNKLSPPFQASLTTNFTEKIYSVKIIGCFVLGYFAITANSSIVHFKHCFEDFGPFAQKSKENFQSFS